MTTTLEVAEQLADELYGLHCDIGRLEVENARLRELVRDYHTFLALVELAQPIGHIVAAHGHPTLSIAALDERYRELGVEVDK